MARAPRPRACTLAEPTQALFLASSTLSGRIADSAAAASGSGWPSQRELARSPRPFAAERPQLLCQIRIPSLAVILESLPGLSNRQHQRHSPPAERAHHELHGVYRLQTLYAAGCADQTDDLISQVGRLSAGEQLQPVERILERAADGAVIQWAAPDKTVSITNQGAHRLHCLRRTRDCGIVHRQCEITNVKQSSASADLRRTLECDFERRKARGILSHRAPESHDQQSVLVAFAVHVTPF